VVDVQRAGASTGMPTKTSQSDLYQAMFGRHGEAPLPVLAATSPVDCFKTMLEAFAIAIAAMSPVIVLLDAYIVNAAEPWQIPDVDDITVPQWSFNQFAKPYLRDQYLARSWNIPGTPGLIHQLGGLEKQGEEGRVSYDASNHQTMVKTRAQKIANVTRLYAPLRIEGHEHAAVLLVGWGSTYGSLQAVLQLCSAAGLRIALLHLRHLNPLPADLGRILKAYPQVFVAELNSGQLCQIIRGHFLVDAQAITQCSGQPFSASTIFNALQAELSHASASV